MGKLERFNVPVTKLKPFKGCIYDWEIRRFDKQRYPQLDENEGYVIFGHPDGHPNFTNWIMTSAVVWHDPLDNEIETLNSRYRLIGEGREGKMIGRS